MYSVICGIDGEGRKTESIWNLNTKKAERRKGNHQRALLQGLLFCPLEFNSSLSMHSELYLWRFLCCEQDGAILVCPTCLQQHSTKCWVAWTLETCFSSPGGWNVPDQGPSIRSASLPHRKHLHPGSSRNGWKNPHLLSGFQGHHPSHHGAVLPT